MGNRVSSKIAASLDSFCKCVLQPVLSETYLPSSQPPGFDNLAAIKAIKPTVHKRLLKYTVNLFFTNVDLQKDEVEARLGLAGLDLDLRQSRACEPGPTYSELLVGSQFYFTNFLILLWVASLEELTTKKKAVKDFFNDDVLPRLVEKQKEVEEKEHSKSMLSKMLEHLHKQTLRAIQDNRPEAGELIDQLIGDIKEYKNKTREEMISEPIWEKQFNAQLAEFVNIAFSLLILWKDPQSSTKISQESSLRQNLKDLDLASSSHEPHLSILSAFLNSPKFFSKNEKESTKSFLMSNQKIFSTALIEDTYYKISSQILQNTDEHCFENIFLAGPVGFIIKKDFKNKEKKDKDDKKNGESPQYRIVTVKKEGDSKNGNLSIQPIDIKISHTHKPQYKTVSGFFVRDDKFYVVLQKNSFSKATSEKANNISTLVLASYNTSLNDFCDAVSLDANMKYHFSAETKMISKDCKLKMDLLEKQKIRAAFELSEKHLSSKWFLVQSTLVLHKNELYLINQLRCSHEGRTLLTLATFKSSPNYGVRRVKMEKFLMNCPISPKKPKSKSWESKYKLHAFSVGDFIYVNHRETESFFVKPENTDQLFKAKPIKNCVGFDYLNGAILYKDGDVLRSKRIEFRRINEKICAKSVIPISEMPQESVIRKIGFEPVSGITSKDQNAPVHELVSFSFLEDLLTQTEEFETDITVSSLKETFGGGKSGMSFSPNPKIFRHFRSLLETLLKDPKDEESNFLIGLLTNLSSCYFLTLAEAVCQSAAIRNSPNVLIDKDTVLWFAKTLFDESQNTAFERSIKAKLRIEWSIEQIISKLQIFSSFQDEIREVINPLLFYKNRVSSYIFEITDSATTIKSHTSKEMEYLLDLIETYKNPAEALKDNKFDFKNFLGPFYRNKLQKAMTNYFTECDTFCPSGNTFFEKILVRLFKKSEQQEELLNALIKVFNDACHRDTFLSGKLEILEQNHMEEKKELVLQHSLVFPLIQGLLQYLNYMSDLELTKHGKAKMYTLQFNNLVRDNNMTKLLNIYFEFPQDKLIEEVSRVSLKSPTLPASLQVISLDPIAQHNFYLPGNWPAGASLTFFLGTLWENPNGSEEYKVKYFFHDTLTNSKETVCLKGVWKVGLMIQPNLKIKIDDNQTFEVLHQKRMYESPLLSTNLKMLQNIKDLTLKGFSKYKNLNISKDDSYLHYFNQIKINDSNSPEAKLTTFMKDCVGGLLKEKKESMDESSRFDPSKYSESLEKSKTTLLKNLFKAVDEYAPTNLVHKSVLNDELRDLMSLLGAFCVLNPSNPLEMTPEQIKELLDQIIPIGVHMKRLQLSQKIIYQRLNNMTKKYAWFKEETPSDTAKILVNFLILDISNEKFIELLELSKNKWNALEAHMNTISINNGAFVPSTSMQVIEYAQMLTEFFKNHELWQEGRFPCHAESSSSSEQKRKKFQDLIDNLFDIIASWISKTDENGMDYSDTADLFRAIDVEWKDEKIYLMILNKIKGLNIVGKGVCKRYIYLFFKFLSQILVKNKLEKEDPDYMVVQALICQWLKNTEEFDSPLIVPTPKDLHVTRTLTLDVKKERKAGVVDDFEEIYEVMSPVKSEVLSFLSSASSNRATSESVTEESSRIDSDDDDNEEETDEEENDEEEENSESSESSDLFHDSELGPSNASQQDIGALPLDNNNVENTLIQSEEAGTDALLSSGSIEESDGGDWSDDLDDEKSSPENHVSAEAVDFFELCDEVAAWFDEEQIIQEVRNSLPEPLEQSPLLPTREVTQPNIARSQNNQSSRSLPPVCTPTKPSSQNGPKVIIPVSSAKRAPLPEDTTPQQEVYRLSKNVQSRANSRDSDALIRKLSLDLLALLSEKKIKVSEELKDTVTLLIKDPKSKLLSTQLSKISRLLPLDEEEIKDVQASSGSRKASDENNETEPEKKGTSNNEKPSKVGDKSLGSSMTKLYLNTISEALPGSLVTIKDSNKIFMVLEYSHCLVSQFLKDNILVYWLEGLYQYQTTPKFNREVYQHCVLLNLNSGEIFCAPPDSFYLCHEPTNSSITKKLAAIKESIKEKTDLTPILPSVPGGEAKYSLRLFERLSYFALSHETPLPSAMIDSDLYTRLSNSRCTNLAAANTTDLRKYAKSFYERTETVASSQPEQKPVESKFNRLRQKLAKSSFQTKDFVRQPYRIEAMEEYCEVSNMVDFSRYDSRLYKAVIEELYIREVEAYESRFGSSLESIFDKLLSSYFNKTLLRVCANAGDNWQTTTATSLLNKYYRLCIQQAKGGDPSSDLLNTLIRLSESVQDCLKPTTLKTTTMMTKLFTMYCLLVDFYSLAENHWQQLNQNKLGANHEGTDSPYYKATKIYTQTLFDCLDHYLQYLQSNLYSTQNILFDSCLRQILYDLNTRLEAPQDIILLEDRDQALVRCLVFLHKNEEMPFFNDDRKKELIKILTKFFTYNLISSNISEDDGSSIALWIQKVKKNQKILKRLKTHSSDSQDIDSKDESYGKFVSKDDLVRGYLMTLVSQQTTEDIPNHKKVILRPYQPTRVDLSGFKEWALATVEEEEEKRPSDTLCAQLNNKEETIGYLPLLSDEGSDYLPLDISELSIWPSNSIPRSKTALKSQNILTQIDTDISEITLTYPLNYSRKVMAIVYDSIDTEARYDTDLSMLFDAFYENDTSSITRSSQHRYLVNGFIYNQFERDDESKMTAYCEQNDDNADTIAYSSVSDRIYINIKYNSIHKYKKSLFHMGSNNCFYGTLANPYVAAYTRIIQLHELFYIFVCQNGDMVFFNFCQEPQILSENFINVFLNLFEKVEKRQFSDILLEKSEDLMNIAEKMKDKIYWSHYFKTSSYSIVDIGCLKSDSGIDQSEYLFLVQECSETEYNLLIFPLLDIKTQNTDYSPVIIRISKHGGIKKLYSNEMHKANPVILFNDGTIGILQSYLNSDKLYQEFNELNAITAACWGGKELFVLCKPDKKDSVPQLYHLNKEGKEYVFEEHQLNKALDFSEETQIFDSHQILIANAKPKPWCFLDERYCKLQNYPLMINHNLKTGKTEVQSLHGDPDFPLTFAAQDFEDGNLGLLLTRPCKIKLAENQCTLDSANGLEKLLQNYCESKDLIDSGEKDKVVIDWKRNFQDMDDLKTIWNQRADETPVPTVILKMQGPVKKLFLNLIDAVSFDDISMENLHISCFPNCSCLPENEWEVLKQETKKIWKPHIGELRPSQWSHLYDILKEHSSKQDLDDNDYVRSIYDSPFSIKGKKEILRDLKNDHTELMQRKMFEVEHLRTMHYLLIMNYHRTINIFKNIQNQKNPYDVLDIISHNLLGYYFNEYPRNMLMSYICAGNSVFNLKIDRFRAGEASEQKPNLSLLNQFAFQISSKIRLNSFLLSLVDCVETMFVGEDGFDAGGLLREFFEKLGQESIEKLHLFVPSPNFGLSYEENNCFIPNPSLTTWAHMGQFFAFGMCLGWAYINNNQTKLDLVSVFWYLFPGSHFLQRLHSRVRMDRLQAHRYQDV